LKTYREPLRTLVGQYESELYGRKLHPRTYRNFSDNLWRFFSHFPKKSRPEQFHLADCEDYREMRREEGAAYSTVRYELCSVRAFFSWLQVAVPDYRDLPNPVVIPVWPQPPDSDADSTTRVLANSAS
jgi:site-specific recombinase XerD